MRTLKKKLVNLSKNSVVNFVGKGVFMFFFSNLTNSILNTISPIHRSNSKKSEDIDLFEEQHQKRTKNVFYYSAKRKSFKNNLFSYCATGFSTISLFYSTNKLLTSTNLSATISQYLLIDEGLEPIVYRNIFGKYKKNNYLYQTNNYLKSQSKAQEQSQSEKKKLEC